MNNCVQLYFRSSKLRKKCEYKFHLCSFTFSVFSVEQILSIKSNEQLCINISMEITFSSKNINFEILCNSSKTEADEEYYLLVSI